MVILINYKSKRNSRYTCDSCGKLINGEQRIPINNGKTKQYDLCKDCWKRIRTLVEKHYLQKLKFKKKGDKE